MDLPLENPEDFPLALRLQVIGLKDSDDSAPANQPYKKQKVWSWTHFHIEVVRLDALTKVPAHVLQVHVMWVA